MEETALIKKLKSCAELFYQNKGQEAYQMLNDLLPEMNRVLQNLAALAADREAEVAYVLQAFMEAFQRKDTLGLADVLGYTIPDLMAVMTENEWEEALEA